jgi:ABC-type lipoprotein release transport system permease subunit
MAVASLVLGIFWLFWIGSVLALVFGYIARNQIRQRPQKGAGLATAGIVLGYIGVAVFAFFFILGFIAGFQEGFEGT